MLDVYNVDRNRSRKMRKDEATFAFDKLLLLEILRLMTLKLELYDMPFIGYDSSHFTRD